MELSQRKERVMRRIVFVLLIFAIFMIVAFSCSGTAWTDDKDPKPAPTASEEFVPLSKAKVGDTVYVLHTRLYTHTIWHDKYTMWVDIDGAPIRQEPFIDERYGFKALKGKVLSTEGDGLVEFIDPEDGSLEFCQDPYSAQITRLVPVDNGPVIHLGRVKGRHFWKVRLKRKFQLEVVEELLANEIRLRLYEAASSLKPIWISARYLHFGFVVIPDGTNDPLELPWFWMDTWAPVHPDKFKDNLGPALKVTPIASTPDDSDAIPFYCRMDLTGCKVRWDVRVDLRRTVQCPNKPGWLVLPETKGSGPVRWTPAYGLPASFHGDVPHGKVVPADLTPPWVKPQEHQPFEKPGEKK